MTFSLTFSEAPPQMSSLGKRWRYKIPTPTTFLEAPPHQRKEQSKIYVLNRKYIKANKPVCKSREFERDN